MPAAPDGGTKLKFNPGGDIDNGSTSLTLHSQGANKPGYFKTAFTNGADVTYEVWIFDNGDSVTKQM